MCPLTYWLKISHEGYPFHAPDSLPLPRHRGRFENSLITLADCYPLAFALICG